MFQFVEQVVEQVKRTEIAEFEQKGVSEVHVTPAPKVYISAVLPSFSF